MGQSTEPAGRVQSSSEMAGEWSTREAHQPPHPTDAHTPRPGQADRDTRHPAGDSHHTASPQHASTASGSDSDASRPGTLTRASISEPALSVACPGSGAHPGRLVAAEGSGGGLVRDPVLVAGRWDSKPGVKSFLVMVARLAAFTDVFLSGLIIPLIPTILQTRGHVPHQQVQIWTSVLVAAYGAAFAVMTPLMPLLTRQGPSRYAVLLAGLASAAAAFALLQFSSDLSLLILGRAVQGLAAAAIIGTSSGILATAASSGRAWFTPAFAQNAAMATAPLIAGVLHDYHGADAVFYCGYALIVLNLVLGLVAASMTATIRPVTREDAASLLGSQTAPGGYGTIAPEAGHPGERSPRSLSPTAPAPGASQQTPASVSAAVHWSPRLCVALGGYLVLVLLTSALHSVLPLFAQRHFNWPVLARGYLFVPLSAPAAVAGLLSGTLVSRAPRSARFLVATGFIASLPALLNLGRVSENNKLVQHAFLLTLTSISFASGITGDPLLREVEGVAASSGHSWSTTAHATILPYYANAWGTLIGPLVAGAANWLWGWKTMSQTLAVIAGAAGVVSLLFLQGWIRRPYQGMARGRPDAGSDEESAPLLANSCSNRAAPGQPKVYGSKEEYHSQRRDSDDVSPHTRTEADRKDRRHRRHFSVDNFSVATTAAGSMDSSTSSVRFQAALETPMQWSANGGRRRSETSDTASKASTERRYVMREAPHAPATDPLLAAGSLYVIDEERDTASGVETARQKRRVVVYPEGTAPPELLERHRHHVVAINALDGTAQMVSDTTHNHAVHVTEETAEYGPAFSEAASRRYVVVVVEGEDASAE